jgi:hypothetical protein
MKKKETMKEREKKRPLGVNRLLRITNFWTAKINSTFWLGASFGDPKISISIVRFMGTLIEFMYSFTGNIFFTFAVSVNVT